MNSRQRMFTVAAGGIPDTVPIAPCYPNLYLQRYQCQAYVEACQSAPGSGLRCRDFVGLGEFRLQSLRRLVDAHDVAAVPAARDFLDRIARREIE